MVLQRILLPQHDGPRPTRTLHARRYVFPLPPSPSVPSLPSRPPPFQTPNTYLPSPLPPPKHSPLPPSTVPTPTPLSTTKKHCLELLRQAAICKGDTSITAFKWLRTGHHTLEPSTKEGVMHAPVRELGSVGEVGGGTEGRFV